MKPALVLDVLIAHFPYGGNGGYQSEHPHIRKWEVQTVLAAKKDPRVGTLDSLDFSDTPIPMTRNAAVRMAQQMGKHVLVMIDSDQSPFHHVGSPGHKLFWNVAFDAIYEHYQKGPLVIGAPYCGPPPHENVYIFQFESNMSHLGRDETVIRLEQYSRAQAAIMTGLGEVAALPTGLIMFDMRAFDIYKPSLKSKRQVLEQLHRHEITIEQAARDLTEGWFYYQWTDGYASKKASTEDVTVTRDIGLAVVQTLGYNPLRCAWDSWIGHHKPWCVGKPEMLTVEQVADSFGAVVMRNQFADERITEFRSPILDELMHEQRPSTTPEYQYPSARSTPSEPDPRGVPAPRPRRDRKRGK